MCNAKRKISTFTTLEYIFIMVDVRHLQMQDYNQSTHSAIYQIKHQLVSTKFNNKSQL